MTELVPCWNCGQSMRAGTGQCVFCGVSQQQSRPAQFVVAPTAAAAEASVAPSVSVAPAVASPIRQQRPLPASREQRRALDPAFHGSAASAGAQVASFTIDVVVVLAATTTVLALTGNTVYAALAFIEIVAALWVLEARTGATVGNLLLRLRASRDDAPYSPGVGRSFVRRMLIGVGFLAAGVGAWVVAGSGAWDRTGGKRGWADAAARTLVVAVPPRSARPAPAAAATSAGTTTVASADSAPVVLVAPQVVSTLARASAANEDSMSQSRTGTPETAFAGHPVMAPVEQAIPGDPQGGAAAEPAVGMILLAFDTGQREQFATPVAVNIGRSPVVTEPADVLVTVQNHESTVSKTHLRLEHSRGRTWVTDGNSTNGTQLLDDEGGVTTLESGVRVLLDEGTRVRIGNRAFTVSILLGGEK